MRYFCLIILFFASHLFAQQRYEAYVVNDGYYIVDLKTMTKINTPDYIGQHSAYLDVLCMKGNSFMDFYDLQNGFFKRFNQFRPDVVYINKEAHFCFYDNETTYLIPGTYSKKIKLPKKYHYLRSEEKYLICKYNELYDVYDSSNLGKPILTGLNATDYIFRKVQDKVTNTITGLHLFYGKDKTFFYDSNFELIRTEISTSDFYKVEQLVLNNYMILEDVPKGRDDFFINEGLFEKNANSLKVTKGITYEISTYRFFDWTFYDSDDTLILHNYKRKEYYVFKVDFKNRRFLIPSELQNQIGLEFVKQ